MKTIRLLLTPALAFFLIAVLNQATVARAQPLPSGASSADSSRVLRDARTRQAAFERLRRSRLPESRGSGSSTCDERIGRFCLSHSPDRDDWVVPPEPPGVRAERAALIEILREASAALPGDAWIAGQRVRYLVEARRFAEAFEAAAHCRAASWWCPALRGFAYHHAALAEAADSAFDVALDRMDPTERRRWNDLTLLLNSAERNAYRRLDETGRQAFEERFWRFADPLFTRPGNELRSEHFSRHVWDALQDRAQAPDGVSWGADLREIVIRYGWPSGWEHVGVTQPPGGQAAVTAHYSSSPQSLMPPDEALSGSGTGGTWDVEDARSRTGYNILLPDSVARWFHPVAHQIAFFYRGDRALAVAAYQLPEDSVTATEPVEVGLGLLQILDVDWPISIAKVAEAGPTGAVMANFFARPIVWSLELYVPGLRRLARVRAGRDIAPLDPGRLGLSDILLFDPGGQLPDSLPDVVPLSRPSNRLLPGDTVGLFWEVYGLPVSQEATLDMSLSLRPEQTGILQRLGQGVGLLRKTSPVRLTWQESARSTPHVSRSLSLAIPDIAPGRYSLVLTVETPGQETVIARREVVVGTPDGR